MGRKALLEPESRAGLTKRERERRAAEEAAWRNGRLADYEPVALDDAGYRAFATIASALPPDRVTLVDGYTIEAAADAIAKMQGLRSRIDEEGVITADGQQNRAVLAYAKYAEIAKRFLVELGCTPSARAKIANDAAASASRHTTVADIFADDDG